MLLERAGLRTLIFIRYSQKRVDSSDTRLFLLPKWGHAADKGAQIKRLGKGDSCVRIRIVHTEGVQPSVPVAVFVFLIGRRSRVSLGGWPDPIVNGATLVNDPSYPPIGLKRAFRVRWSKRDLKLFARCPPRE